MCLIKGQASLDLTDNVISIITNYRCCYPRISHIFSSDFAVLYAISYTVSFKAVIYLFIYLNCSQVTDQISYKVHSAGTTTVRYQSKALTENLTLVAHVVRPILHQYVR